MDISKLSSEKRAFLKANPEFLKSLEQQIPKQVAEIQKHKEKLRKGKAKWQRNLHVDRPRLTPALRDIEEKYRERDRERATIVSNLVCLECGEGDKGNRVNGKPWCMNCNAPLIPKDKVDKWGLKPRIRVLHKSLKDDFKRRELDF